MIENYLDWILFIFNFFFPQGITVKLDDKDDLVIARILQGSLIDKQGNQICLVFKL